MNRIKKVINSFLVFSLIVFMSFMLVSCGAEEYTINVISSNNEYGIVSGGKKIQRGDYISVRATANAGYKFINWTEGEEIVSTDVVYRFDVYKNRNLVANFREKETYTVVVMGNTGQGTVSGGGEYVEDDVAMLVAIANEGYIFIGWELEDGTIFGQGSSSYNMIIKKDLYIVALFVQRYFTEETWFQSSGDESQYLKFNTDGTGALYGFPYDHDMSHGFDFHYWIFPDYEEYFYPDIPQPSHGGYLFALSYDVPPFDYNWFELSEDGRLLNLWNDYVSYSIVENPYES